MKKLLILLFFVGILIVGCGNDRVIHSRTHYYRTTPNYRVYTPSRPHIVHPPVYRPSVRVHHPPVRVHPRPSIRRVPTYTPSVHRTPSVRHTPSHRSTAPSRHTLPTRTHSGHHSGPTPKNRK